jgi:sugar phosphate isomerase/epimerase
MINKERIGFFIPSMGNISTNKCLEFVKKRGGLIQAWTLSNELAHESKDGMPYDIIKRETMSGNLRVSSFSGYMDWTEASENESRIAEFQQIIKQCVKCGSKIICTETGRNFINRNDKKAWDVLTHSMKIICLIAEKKDISIAIEMGRNDLVFGVDNFKKLQDKVRSNALKINFDPANLRRGDLDPITVLQELKDDVVQFHLKDADKDGMKPLTEGDVDFASLIKILENNNFDGNYIIEQEYEAVNMFDAIKNDYNMFVLKYNSNNK